MSQQLGISGHVIPFGSNFGYFLRTKPTHFCHPMATMTCNVCCPRYTCCLHRRADRALLTMSAFKEVRWTLKAFWDRYPFHAGSGCGIDGAKIEEERDLYIYYVCFSFSHTGRKERGMKYSNFGVMHIGVCYISIDRRCVCMPMDVHMCITKVDCQRHI